MSEKPYCCTTNARRDSARAACTKADAPPRTMADEEASAIMSVGGLLMLKAVLGSMMSGVRAVGTEVDTVIAAANRSTAGDGGTKQAAKAMVARSMMMRRPALLTEPDVTWT